MDKRELLKKYLNSDASERPLIKQAAKDFHLIDLVESMTYDEIFFGEVFKNHSLYADIIKRFSLSNEDEINFIKANTPDRFLEYLMLVNDSDTLIDYSSFLETQPIDLSFLDTGKEKGSNTICKDVHSFSDNELNSILNYDFLKTQNIQNGT